MTGVDVGRSRAAADLLVEVAGPDLYRRNPFRVTGLATTATAREVRQRRRSVLATIDWEGSTAACNDRRLPLRQPPSPEEVRAAFDALERDDRRLVFELFWWWGAPEACGCDERVHECHDVAVEEHAKALDLELNGARVDPAVRDEQWEDAADAWAEALEEEGFWDHVRHRLRALPDRSLDESTVAGLRQVFPAALLQPLVMLVRRSDPAAGMAKLLDWWDFDDEVIAEARQSAAAPVYERTETLLEEVRGLSDRGQHQQAARRAAELPAAATRLEALLPHGQFRRSAKLRNQISVTMNNCALAVAESSGRGRPASELLELAGDLLEQASRLGVESDDQEAIERNLAYVRIRLGLDAEPPDRTNHDLSLELLVQRVRANPRDSRDLLYQAWRNTTDPQLRAEIGRLIDRLPQPRCWLANIAMCAGMIIGIVGLLVGRWDTSTATAVIVTLLLSPLLLAITYSHWYRVLARDAVSVGLALVGIVSVISIAIGSSWVVMPAIWCLGAFVLGWPVTGRIGRYVVESWRS